MLEATPAEMTEASASHEAIAAAFDADTRLGRRTLTVVTRSQQRGIAVEHAAGAGANDQGESGRLRQNLFGIKAGGLELGF